VRQSSSVSAAEDETTAVADEATAVAVESTAVADEATAAVVEDTAVAVEEPTAAVVEDTAVEADEPTVSAADEATAVAVENATVLGRATKAQDIALIKRFGVEVTPVGVRACVDCLVPQVNKQRQLRKSAAEGETAAATPGHNTALTLTMLLSSNTHPTYPPTCLTTYQTINLSACL
jgi:hypothetical protein